MKHSQSVNHEDGYRRPRDESLSLQDFYLTAFRTEHNLSSPCRRIQRVQTCVHNLRSQPAFTLPFRFSSLSLFPTSLRLFLETFYLYTFPLYTHWASPANRTETGLFITRVSPLLFRLFVLLFHFFWTAWFLNGRSKRPVTSPISRGKAYTRAPSADIHREDSNAIFAETLERL
jgi:hypothetical protein